MTFLVQFSRIRRGAREVIRTVTVAAGDSSAALARARSCIGTSRLWPVKTDALRVMDDGGRTLLDWDVPARDAQPSPSSPNLIARTRFQSGALPASQSPPDDPTRAVAAAPTDHTHLEVGQAISYAEDGQPEIWKGGYQIIGETEPNAAEATYTIRSADETHDRVVKEHELREDLGARTRGR